VAFSGRGQLPLYAAPAAVTKRRRTIVDVTTEFAGAERRTLVAGCEGADAQ
jgi:hypothetical protein